MACPECDITRRQYVDAQRMSALPARRTWRRSANPSVTELQVPAWRDQLGEAGLPRRRTGDYPSWRLIAMAACICVLLSMIFP